MSVGGRLSHTIFGDIKMIDFGRDDVFTKLGGRTSVLGRLNPTSLNSYIKIETIYLAN